MPDAIEDLFGNVTDTLKFGVSTKSPDSYGTIGLAVQNAKSFPFILELTDEKGKVIQRVISNENRRYKFEFLEPKTYTFKIIYDTNKNGRWDGGNFLKRIAPGEVVFFDKKREIRANWEEPHIFAFMAELTDCIVSPIRHP